MSEVEETLERIKNHKGVEGYVIADRNGNVLRRHPQMQLPEAEKYALYMKELTTKARGVVRDLNPKNDLQYMRVRVKKLELLIAHGTNVMTASCYAVLHGNARVLCRERLPGGRDPEMDADQQLNKISRTQDKTGVCFVRTARFAVSLQQNKLKSGCRGATLVDLGLQRQHVLPALRRDCIFAATERHQARHAQPAVQVLHLHSKAPS